MDVKSFPRRYRLSDLASEIGADLRGDGDLEITSLATLQDAQADQLSFLANPSYQQFLHSTKAGAVIIAPPLADQYPGNRLVTDQPYLAYARLTALFAPARPAPGVHSSAVISPDAKVDSSAAIGALVVIEAGAEVGEGCVLEAGCYLGRGAKLGRHCRLFANVTVYSDVIVGDNATLHSGAVLGADGFGFAPSPDGWEKIYQLGTVRIGDHVEVGAGTTVDRGALGDTVIGHCVKLDNQVQIAHNVQIGDYTAIAACSAVAGSTRIGKRCTIAGAVGIVGHLDIADNVHVSAMTLVTKSIPEAGSYSSGTPMQDTRQWRKSAVRFAQLEQLNDRVKKLEKTLQVLEQEKSNQR